MFYSRLNALCAERGVKITNVIAEMGMGSGNLSKWKAGGVPKGDTLSKLADYFHVSTDYLLGRTDDPRPVGEEKGPAPVSVSEPSYPPEYDLLTPANKAIVDRLIIDLAKNQTLEPTKLYIAARDGSRVEVEVDGEITLPAEDSEIPE